MIEFIPDGGDLPSLVVRTMTRVFVRTTLATYPLEGPLAGGMRLVDVAFAPVPRLRDTTVEHVRGATWRAELVRADRAGADVDAGEAAGVVLYFHGGAFLFGGLRSHRRVVERLAVRTGLPVLTVDYRQLPVARHEDTLGDCLDAWRHLVEDRGIDPSRIVLAGDSAGGHLAFSVALRVATERGERPAGILAYSPWLDFDNAAKSGCDRVGRDAMIPAARLDRVARLVLGAGGDDDPAAVGRDRSPVNADLSVLPPVLIMCAEDEVLRLDAELMERRITAAGGSCHLLVWQGMVHAFPVLAHTLGQSARALRMSADFVHACLTGSAAAHPRPVLPRTHLTVAS